MTLVHGLLTRQSVRGVGIKEQRRLRLLSVRLHQNTPPINQFYPKLALKRIVNDIHEFLVMEVKHELVPTEESFGVSVNPRDRLDLPRRTIISREIMDNFESSKTLRKSSPLEAQ